MIKPDQETLDKLAKKRWFKLRGIVKEITITTVDNGSKTICTNILVQKGQGKNKTLYFLSAFGKTSLEIDKLKEGFRIKVWFTIKSIEYKGKYFTNLRVESFEHWEVNEDKIKREQRKQELIEAQTQIKFNHKPTEF